VRRLFLIPLLVALVTPVSAQRFGSAPHGTPHFTSRAPGARSAFYPVPFFSDFGGDSYFANPVGPQPTVIVLQSAAAPAPEPPPPAAQPLTIELQGGRYVRVSGEVSSDAEVVESPLPTASKIRVSSTESGAAAADRPAVLVFLDGHREELTGYTITAGVLYAQTNFYTDGSWNKKVEISSLNLPGTVNENHRRGIDFHLPTAPNEVVVGP